MLILTSHILVKSVADALAESIYASVAGRLGLLVADALVVSIRIVGLRARRQLNCAILGRHLALSAGGRRPLANIGAASLRNGIILVGAASRVRPLRHA